jgi:hypothetical protein
MKIKGKERFNGYACSIFMMEVAMSDNPVPHYPAVEMVINAIADWIKKYRQAVNLNNELARCSPDEVKTMATDLGLTPSDLRTLAAQGPGAADLLKKMLIALKIDPHILDEIDPLTARDLQRSCILCGEKRRCKQELAAGTAASNMHEFCPNAVTLESLFKAGSAQPVPVH